MSNFSDAIVFSYSLLNSLAAPLARSIDVANSSYDIPSRLSNSEFSPPVRFISSNASFSAFASFSITRRCSISGLYFLAASDIRNELMFACVSFTDCVYFSCCATNRPSSSRSICCLTIASSSAFDPYPFSSRCCWTSISPPTDSSSRRKSSIRWPVSGGTIFNARDVHSPSAPHAFDIALPTAAHPFAIPLRLVCAPSTPLATPLSRSRCASYRRFCATKLAISDCIRALRNPSRSLSFSAPRTGSANDCASSPAASFASIP